ncbi:Flp family type IVb pilin [Jiella avicenniae]|uniref:Flp family type IVb pilin n=1 Tax=Jiella avicenniae TaxID=2907202 RepID=A0A9X1P2T8_9HYPH|nr:Flp family type IVb pilin [Jiella avicenniae]MCE7030337.1 Flp family type IVb pilin [Jiella avicenniae]
MGPLVAMAPRAMTSFRRFGRNEHGATAIEYGIIGVVMAIGILAAFPLLKEPLETLATTIGDAMGK